MQTTCPACRNYLTVPNVQGEGTFQCPYCPQKTRLTLYKCYSCMKVSAFLPNAIPRACPRCSTLVRSSEPLFIEGEWLYHVTSREVAGFIKTGGLRSAFARTGKITPDPGGSFAIDRLQRIDKKTHQKLKEYVFKLIVAGATTEQITRANVPYAPFPFVYRGTNDDYPVLTDRESGKLDTFASTAMLSRSSKKLTMKERTAIKDVTAVELESTLFSQKTHYLTQLAAQVAEVDFGIEGAITAQHVYFLNSKSLTDMQSGFRDYTKFRLPLLTAVLRIRRTSVLNLHQDEADHRALRTKESVSGALFEIMINTTNPQEFLNLNFRGRFRNWMPLKDWTP